MANRHRGGRSFRQGPRRATSWIASTDQAVIIGIGGGNVLLNQSITGAQTDGLGPFTITRTIGSLWARSDQVIAAEEALLGIGMSVVTEQARAAGAGSIPAPFRDEDEEQFFVYAIALASMQVAGTPGNFSGDSWARVDFDSRAQRKVQPGEAIVVVVENASTAFAVDFFVKFRMLIKFS